MNKLLFVSLAFWSLFYQFSFGQSFSWQWLDAPNGGDVYCFKKNGPTITMAGTSRGFYQNGGAVAGWNYMVSSTIGDSAIFSIATNASGQIFAGTASGLYISNNGSSNFQFAGDERLKDKIHAVNVLPNGKIIAAAETNGLFVSENNGQSWLALTPDSLVLHNVRAIFIDNQNRILIGDSAGVWISDAAGDAWTLSPVGGERIFSLTQQPNGGALFAGTRSKGVYRSDDGGLSWIAANDGIANVKIQALVCDGLGKIYAGTPTGIVFQSADTGQSWIARLVLPGPNAILTLNYLDGQLLAGTMRFGVYASSDGVTWSADNVGLRNTTIKAVASPTANNYFVSVDDIGVYASADSGRTWTLRNNGIGSYQVQCLYAQSADTVFAGVTGASKIYRTYNGGLSWSPAGNGLSNVAQINQIVRGTDGALYAATFNKGIFRSVDNGSNWTAFTSTGLLSQNITCILADTAKGIYCGAKGKGIYKYDKATDQWKPFANGLTTAVISQIVRGADDTLFVGTNRGVFKYIGTWKLVFEIGFDETITGLIERAPGQWFASTSVSGLYVSKDNGETWKQANNGLDHPYISALSLDSKFRLLAGTLGFGLYGSNETDRLFVGRDEPEALNSPFQLRIYPNPATDFVTLQWQTSRSANLKVELLDAQGRIIEKVLEGRFDVGNYQKVLNLSGLPAGLYYLKHDAGAIRLIVR